MNLFDNLKKYDTPEEVQAPEFICRIKATKSGRQIMLCSVDPAPQAAIDEANAAGFPLFVASEIEKLAGFDQKTVDSVIVAKINAPGCSVFDVLDKGGRQ